MNPLQYSCLENSMERGAWRDIAMGSQSQAWLSAHTHTHTLLKPSCTNTTIVFFTFSSVQLLSCVWLFVTPWRAVCQASLSITHCQSLPKPTSIELVMPSNHLILCHPLLRLPSIFPSNRSFQMSQLFASGGQSIGVSASFSLSVQYLITYNGIFSILY